MTEVAALGLRVAGVADIDSASSSLDRFTKSSRSADQASGSLSTESRNTSKSLADVAREGDRSSALMSKLAGAAKLAAGAFAGLKLTGLIKDVTMANSRFEQLGTVMGVVGRNAGLSQAQVAKYAKEVHGMGISMTESRQTVIRMTQAQMDLSKASDLARLAQDAAVIANTNSSDALGRLIYGLQSGQVEILRNMGLNVNFAASYSKLAAEMGVTTDQLSEVDKVQARTNAVMEAGIGIAGAYDASMENAGKQLGSTTRYLQDLGVVWGGVFSKAASDGIFAYAAALKSLAEWTQKLVDSGAVDRLADTIAAISRGVVTGAKVLGAYVVAVYTIPAAKAAATVATTAYQAVLATFSAQVAVTTAQLLTMRNALNVLAAAFAGWQIGTYLRNEFEIVEKAGIALMGGLHSTTIHIGGFFSRLGEDMKFALTNPLDTFRNKLADLLQSLTGLGQSALRVLGLDGFADAIGNGIETIRSKTGEEHKAMLEQMKSDTQREADAVSDIYAEMFADVGKSAGANLKVVGKGLDDVNSQLKEVPTNAGGIGKVDTAFQSLMDTLFPAEAAQRKYNEQIALLRKHLSGDRLAKAIDRLNDSLSDGDHTGPADAIAAYVKELQDLEDKINPAGRAAREFQEEQAKLRAEIERSGDPTGKWTRLLEENERQMRENTRVTNQWTEWTESALERVDSAFADAWRNIGDGFKGFRDNLINGFKQMLAELAHIAITRPIVLQIGAAMGIGGMSGSAMAGIGGGGGGFSLGNVASMGSKIYSAFTGWGRAAVDGWNQSGVTGIFKGIRDYYAGTLSGMGGGLSALTAGMKGAYLAPGLAGPTTAGATGMMGVGNMLGNLSRMAGPLSVIAGALQGYQSAGIKGAAVGAGAAWGGGTLGGMGGAALGQMVGGTLGSVLPGIGTAIGAALGGILAGSLFGGSGERFKRTVGSATGYYGDDGYVSTGPSATWYPGSRQFGAEHDAALDDLNKAFITTIGSLFDAFGVDSTIATTTRTRLRRTSGKMVGDFITEIDGQITNHFRQYSKDGKLGEAMEQFSDDIMGEYLAKTIVGSDLPEYFRQQFEPLVADSKVTAEQVAETLTEIFARFDGVNHVLELTRLAAFELTDAGMRASDAIIALSGGLDALQTSTSVYYDQFFTVAEKQADTVAAVEKAFAAADITLADSREGYRAMVEDIDVTTEAGRQMFAAMMGLAGQAAEYYSIVEQQAAQAAALAEQQAAQLLANVLAYYDRFTSETQKTEDLLSGIVAQFESMGLALPGTRAGFIAAVDGLDTATEAGQRMFETLMGVAGAAGDYYDVLEQQAAQAAQSVADIAREREGLERSLMQLQGNTAELRRRELEQLDPSNRALQEHIWAMQDQESAAREAAAGANSAMRDLQEAFRQLEKSIQAEQTILRDAHNATTQSIRSNMSRVQDAMRDTERVASSLRSTLDGMLRAGLGLEPARAQSQAYLRNVLASGGLGDPRDLERALGIVAEPSEHLFSNFEDYQRDFWRTAKVVSELEERAGEQLTTEQRSLRALERQLSQADLQFAQEMARLDGVLERQTAMLKAELGQLNWLQTVNGSVLSIAGAIAALEFASEAAKPLPQFANGGIASGPMSGYPVELHGTEAVIPLNGSSIPLNVPGIKALVHEVSELRKELAASQRAIAENTGKSARVLEREEMERRQEEFV